MRGVAGALLLVAACGSADLAGPGIPGGPLPVHRGTPAGSAIVQTVGPGGGIVTEGTLTVTIPPNAFAVPTALTIVPVTTSGLIDPVGTTYHLEAGGAQPAAPITVTFTVPSGQAPSTLTIAELASVGYWTRVYSVARDAAAGTVSTSSTLLTDYSLVAVATQQDLSGPVRLDSTQGPRFTATGTITLQYLANGLYMPTGSLSVSMTGCSGPDSQMPVSLAEIHRTTYRWGLNGMWKLSCADGSTPFVSTDFDTLGITNIGCSRAYTAAMPVLATTSEISGQYLIDCTASNGTRVEASWDFVLPSGTPKTVADLPAPGF